MKRAFNYIAFAGLLLGLMSCADENKPSDPGSVQDRYLGVWNVTENTGNNAPQFYTVEILAGADVNTILIEDLYNDADVQVEADIQGTQITIPMQSTVGYTFSGDGSANADFDQISLSFTVNDGTGDDNVEAILVLP